MRNPRLCCGPGREGSKHKHGVAEGAATLTGGRGCARGPPRVGQAPAGLPPLPTQAGVHAGHHVVIGAHVLRIRTIGVIPSASVVGGIELSDMRFRASRGAGRSTLSLRHASCFTCGSSCTHMGVALGKRRISRLTRSKGKGDSCSTRQMATCGGRHRESSTVMVSVNK